jgi:hypothetical protein
MRGHHTSSLPRLRTDPAMPAARDNPRALMLRSTLGIPQIRPDVNMIGSQAVLTRRR